MSGDRGSPQFRLDGRVSLVTAANSGLGRAISLALAHVGSDVVVAVRDPASGVRIVDEIVGLGRRSLCVPLDVTDLAQIREAVATAVDRWARSTASSTTPA